MPSEHVAGATAHNPRLIVFDVNETLSDMAPMGERFAGVGAPAHLAPTWFAGLLRDGFALTVTGDNPAFADLAAELLRVHLAGVVDDVEPAVSHIMAGFGELPVHPDVVEGVRALRALGVTLVTLSNGSTSVAQGLLERNDIEACFTRLLSVQDAPLWKPAAPAYAHALQVCDVEAGEAMLVAVHPWDIHGAHAAGLGTAWIDRSGSARYPSHLHQPDLRVRSLVDLAGQLGARGHSAP